jgi:pimeloyl-ACP methyl ester carboxylesterase
MLGPQDLAVRQLGDGFPVLIIHGWTMSGAAEATDFEPILEKKSGYRRIYIDLPGMGDTPIGSVRDLDSMFECVSNFVEKHILPSHFLLVGSSCGAYIARAIAYRYASEIDGLLLHVPVVESESAKRDLDPFAPVIKDDALVSSLSDTDREKLGEISVQTSEYINALRRKLDEVWLPAVAASDPVALDPIRNDPDRYSLTVPMHTPDEPFSKPTLIVSGRQDDDVGYRDVSISLHVHLWCFNVAACHTMTAAEDTCLARSRGFFNIWDDC